MPQQMNTQYFVFRPLKKILFLIIFLSSLLLVFHFWFSIITSAQEPAPFEISIVPAADFAVQGEVFSYTLTLTNVSQVSIERVGILGQIPAGALFINTTYTNLEWFNRIPDIGESGEILWFTPDTVAPEEVLHFTLIITSDLENSGAFTVEAFKVTMDSRSNVVAETSQLETDIVTPTPLPTVTSSPTPIPPTATYTPTQPPKATSSPTSTSVIIPSATPEIAATEITLEQQVQAVPPQNQQTNFVVLIFVGLLILIFCAIGIGWFIRNRP